MIYCAPLIANPQPSEEASLRRGFTRSARRTAERAEACSQGRAAYTGAVLLAIRNADCPLWSRREIVAARPAPPRAVVKVAILGATLRDLRVKSRQ